MSTIETKTIALTVNGEATKTSAASLSELLDELGYGEAKVATAINGEFVAEPQRRDRQLQDADHVEIVAPRQGG